MVVSMDRWVGKVAIVTGASSGIGSALVEQLVEAGLKVVGFARRDKRVQEQSVALKGRKGALYACKVDMTNEEEIKAGFKWTLENVGPVSILVNNAGVSINSNLTQGDTAVWKKVLDTNVLGLCIATREACQMMKAHNIDGHIVHINSVAGHSVPNTPVLNVYSASKYAVTSLTETLRQELNFLGSKIKISSVSPGFVNTEIFEAGNFELPPGFIKGVPHLNPGDVADAVVYVLSTPASVQVHELTIRPVGEK